ncbi:MAG: N-6 DNA methylase [Bacteroidetes bacterium]|nr:N-6 DNA methylase [Bacteroidota bacterium]
MLDNETKKRIDTARDILVGKVPDPKSQVEQITIALIYKFMDDMDKEAVSFGGKATFFTKEFKKYSWTNIFDTKVGGHEMLTLYGEAIVKLNLNPNIPQLFRDIFKNAYLPYRDPETLKLFLKTINEFRYDHSEMLGDAFEYLLSVLGSQGDAGQFRTPRHIIDFIVEVLQPQKNETILDPACGTAGFLISSYKHILQNNTKKNKGDLLTPDDRKKMMQNFVGYDISPDMVRLSLVNLYLHGFTTPSIYEYDTLTSEDRWSEYYDIILANPPFMTPKGGIKPHKKFTIQANRSEVLFVDYIAEHIHPSKGRAGIIVPEGIIFQSATAYKALRKMLVDKNMLYAVVSLPAGIFNPYSGVKTSILLLDKTLAKKTDNILFVKIESDGFDLGAQRKAIAQNDLTACLYLLQQYKQSLQDNTAFESDNKNVFLIEKKVIGAKDDYNLSIDRYRANEIVNRENEMVRLDEIFSEIRNGKNVEQFDEVGKYRVTRIQTIADGTVNLEKTKWTNDEVKEDDFMQEGDILLSHINSIEHLGKSAIFKNHSEKVVHGINLIRFRPDKEKVIPAFIASVFKSEIFISTTRQFAQKAVNQASIKTTDLKAIEIPLPSLEIQQQIVSKIESFQKIIDGAKQIVENYKPQIDVDPSWEIVKLGDSITLQRGYDLPKQDWVEGKFPIIGSNGIIGFHNSFKEKGPGVVTGRSGTIGKVHFIDYDFYWPHNTSLFVKDFKGNNRKFIKYLLESVDLKSLGERTAAVPSLDRKNAHEISISLPPISVQQTIVNRIDEEQGLVNSNKRLIEIFEQKIKNEINKLWQAAPKEYATPEEKLSIAAEE